MDVYSKKNKKLNSVEIIPFKKEKDIQDLVEQNSMTLFGVDFVSSEFTIGEFRIDTLCFDHDNNSFVIIEYKKGSSYSVIDQGYSYLSKMLNNKDSFILEYCKKKNVSVDVEVDWSESRIIFVSPSFNSYQKNSVNFQDIPFELWEIKQFSNGSVVLNQHISRSNQSIKKVTKGKESVIQKVNKEVRVLNEEDTLNNKKVSENIRELYYNLKERISEWEDFNTNPKSNYISFKRNKKVFVFLKFRKNYMRVHILSYLKTKWDGPREKVSPSNKFVLDDPKKMFKTWENDYKVLYSYDLKDDKNLDYFILMLKQKFDNFG